MEIGLEFELGGGVVARARVGAMCTNCVSNVSPQYRRLWFHHLVPFLGTGKGTPPLQPDTPFVVRREFGFLRALTRLVVVFLREEGCTARLIHRHLGRGYSFSNAIWPGDRLSLYFSMFSAVITKSGLSEANGSP